MNIQETEILVIGAGPSGLIAARKAALSGAEVTVLEEDREIGKPCHCAGLLSLKGMEKISVPTHGSFIQNRVRGAKFFSPSGLSFTVERDEPLACVVDRGLLDKFLAQQATEVGVRIRLDSKVYGVKRIDKGLVSLGKHESFRAKIIIDAEGLSSKILRIIGLKPSEPECLLPGLQFDFNGVNVDPDYVEIHTGRKIAPNFFAWIIPLNADSVRAGLACKGVNPKEHLDRFIKGRFEDKKETERTKPRSGLILTCGPIEKTVDDNFLVVGDAAGQVKPTTGGGVILGGICASIAGEVAAKAVKEGNFTRFFLKKYESLWKKNLEKEFKATYFARRILNHLSDETIDKLFKVIIKKNLQDDLSTEGEIDFQRNVILKMLKRKEILAILPSIWRTLFPFK